MEERKQQAVKEVVEAQNKSPLGRLGIIQGMPGIFEIVKEKDGKPWLLRSVADNIVRPIFPHENFLHLSTIYIETLSEKPVGLLEVLIRMHRFFNGKKCEINATTKEDLLNFFKNIVDNFDPSRMKTSHVKKITRWYNHLVGTTIMEEMLKFVEDMERKSQEEKTEATVPEKPASPPTKKKQEKPAQATQDQGEKKKKVSSKRRKSKSSPQKTTSRKSASSKKK